jgi:hypothetical protein
MTHKFLAVLFAAVLIIASGIAGSFYLAGAQTQDLTNENPSISLGSIQAGSPIAVSGAGFDQNAEVSLYIMSANEANMTDAQWTILQQIGEPAGTQLDDGTGGNLVNDALDALRDLLNVQNESPPTETNSTGRLLVISDGSAPQGTLSLECDDQEIASGDTTSGSPLLSLAAAAGDYSECNLTLRNSNGIIDSAELGGLQVFADSSEEYEESLVGTDSTDSSGEFSAEVTVSETAADRYAILAVANDGQQVAVSRAFSISEAAPPVAEEAQNATSDDAANDTGSAQLPLIEENATSTQENGTTTTNETGEAQVAIDEEEVEAGSPLAIQGDGFEPNAPVTIYINSVQITNVITNVQGSFNTVVIVPTTVNNGSAEVVVETEQTNIVTNVDVVPEDEEDRGPSFIRFNAISADDSSRRLEGAPVTIFDTKTGELVESDKTPFVVELEKGKYSVFYSDYRNFRFESAEPGRWIDTPGGGSGLLTVREGRNATVTAVYDEIPAPPPQPPAESTLILRSQDTDGNSIEGMFVSVYDAETGNRIEQGFTELRIEDLDAGTYPIFFANFGQMTFVTASPGNWVQTPYGGAGLVVIPADGTSREIIVTATYDRATTIVEDVFEIQAPIDIQADVFTITSNQTRPEGPFQISGSMALIVQAEDPISATLSVNLLSVREATNENVNLESQRSRDHDTFHIVDFKPEVASPTGPNSYIVTGTADLLLNGDMYSNDEDIQIIIRGGDDLTPTNVEIQFQGDQRYSGANRLETLYAVVTDGFQ